MSPAFQCGDYRFTLLDRPGPERAFWELRLAAAGLHLPMADTLAWTVATGSESWFLGLEDREGRCRGGAAIQVQRSRALPGFRILRVERFGTGVDSAAWQATLEALARIARERGRVLRLHVELFSVAPAVLARLSEAAGRAGLIPSPLPRCYGTTSLIDLTPEPDQIFAKFHSTARRHVRAVSKHPVEVREVADPALSARMNFLLAETLQRTGGEFESHAWDAILPYSRDNPGRSRVMGLFRTDQSGPEGLLAFAWGCFHGDHAHYSTAASTRATDLRVPMAYSLAWELMQWARAQGAAAFDFGGISVGTHGDDDPLGGISDFKRYFQGATVRVGEEWILEPSPAAARLSRMLRRLGQALGRSSAAVISRSDAESLPKVRETEPTGS